MITFCNPRSKENHLSDLSLEGSGVIVGNCSATTPSDSKLGRLTKTSIPTTSSEFTADLSTMSVSMETEGNVLVHWSELGRGNKPPKHAFDAVYKLYQDDTHVCTVPIHSVMTVEIVQKVGMFTTLTNKAIWHLLERYSVGLSSTGGTYTLLCGFLKVKSCKDGPYFLEELGFNRIATMTRESYLGLPFVELNADTKSLFIQGTMKMSVPVTSNILKSSEMLRNFNSLKITLEQSTPNDFNVASATVEKCVVSLIGPVDYEAVSTVRPRKSLCTFIKSSNISLNLVFCPSPQTSLANNSLKTIIQPVHALLGGARPFNHYGGRSIPEIRGYILNLLNEKSRLQTSAHHIEMAMRSARSLEHAGGLETPRIVSELTDLTDIGRTVMSFVEPINHFEWSEVTAAVGEEDGEEAAEEDGEEAADEAAAEEDEHEDAPWWDLPPDDLVWSDSEEDENENESDGDEVESESDGDEVESESEEEWNEGDE